MCVFSQIDAHTHTHCRFCSLFRGTSLLLCQARDQYLQFAVCLRVGLHVYAGNAHRLSSRQMALLGKERKSKEMKKESQCCTHK